MKKDTIYNRLQMDSRILLKKEMKIRISSVYGCDVMLRHVLRHVVRPVCFVAVLVVLTKICRPPAGRPVGSEVEGISGIHPSPNLASRAEDSGVREETTRREHIRQGEEPRQGEELRQGEEPRQEEEPRKGEESRKGEEQRQGEEPRQGEELSLNVEVRERMLGLHDAGDLARGLRSTATSLLRQIASPARLALVFDLGNFENKGDPALALGQLYLLSRAGIRVLFACDTFCSGEKLESASRLAASLPPAELVVFSSGGGNLGGYPYNDGVRRNLLKRFHNNRFVILSQSTWFHTGPAHLNKVRTDFREHPDLHILLRDTTSYEFARKNFPDTVTVYLAPDMAYGLGPVPRYLQPWYDVIWIQRGDGEAPGKYDVTFPADVTYKVEDWFTHAWGSPRGDDTLDSLVLKTHTGLMFIQRGRVLVTDRLHGHILASLLDVPTVIIDNKIKKISALRDTWTAGLEKVVMATDARDAVNKAVELLHKYYK